MYLCVYVEIYMIDSLDASLCKELLCTVLKAEKSLFLLWGILNFISNSIDINGRPEIKSTKQDLNDSDPSPYFGSRTGCS